MCSQLLFRILIGKVSKSCRPSSPNYIDIEEGQTRTLEFNLAKVEDKTDMFGNPIKKVQYKVRDVERTTIQTEKILELTRKHSAKIYNELKKGTGA